MIYDNARPRYLPHMANPEVLLMGLSPLRETPWIETDTDIGRYHRHKLAQRRERGDAVYRAADRSLPAQRELSTLLRRHLLEAHGALYETRDRGLRCLPGDFSADLTGDESPCTDDGEVLWQASLCVADDLVIMQEEAGQYVLTAASLCCPSHWYLADKFERPMRAIHDPIPGFHTALSDRIERFFSHLRAQHPVVRFNWSVQADDALAQLPHLEPEVHADTPLFYRSERQTLVRLPGSGAIAFTIRVYIHPLEMLHEVEGALPALFAAIENTPPALQHYKGFDALAPALQKYREEYRAKHQENRQA